MKILFFNKAYVFVLIEWLYTFPQVFWLLTLKCLSYFEYVI